MLERLLHHFFHILQIPELCQVLHPILIAVSESECCLYCIRFTIGLLYSSLLWFGRFVLADSGFLYSFWIMCWTRHSCSVVDLLRLLRVLLRTGTTHIARALPSTPYVLPGWILWILCKGAGAEADVLVSLTIHTTHLGPFVPVTEKCCILASLS